MRDTFDYFDYLKNNPLLNESVEEHKWSSMSEEDRENALLSAIKNPDDVERFINLKWRELPPEITQNIDKTLLKEEQPKSNDEPGEGTVAPKDREEAPINYEELADNFLSVLKIDIDMLGNEHRTPKDWKYALQDIVVDTMPPNKQEFRKVWDLLKKNQEYRNIVQHVNDKFDYNLNNGVKEMWEMLEDEDDLNEIEAKIDQKLKEMSMTGGGAGTTGASFTPGEGMNYATPKAFKKKKK